MLTAGRKVSGSSSAPPGHLLSAVRFNPVKTSCYMYYLLKHYETRQFATQCIYTFRMVLTIQTEHFPKQV